MRENPTARDVARTDVLPIREQDPLTRPIESLQKSRVAVLVDEQGKPTSILTVCDLDSLKQRLNNAGSSDKASALFEPKPVFTVGVDTPLDQVAQTLSQNRLGTGIAVVDEKGSFVGYAFNEDVRGALDTVVTREEREVKSTLRRLGSEYPELKSRLVS